jgi:mitochondrial fission protein ELM1
VKSWVLSDGAAGNETQALALAAALGFEVERWRLRPNRRAALCAPHFGRLADLHDPARGRLAPPWPAVAIGCGRIAALATRRLREQGARVVQVLDPRVDPALYDAVVAPRHDGLHGANVVTTLGSLNGVDTDWLAAARARFPELCGLPGPRTVVLVGGPTRHLCWDASDLAALIDRVHAWLDRDGGSLLLSTSRRTPAWAVERLRGALEPRAALFHTPGAGDGNPYPGLLAAADRLLVSGDSVNMLSEACAVGVPVYRFPERAPRGRLAAFHAGLLGAGHLQDPALPPRPVAPLRETATVAARVAALLGLRASAAPDSRSSPESS